MKTVWDTLTETEQREVTEIRRIQESIKSSLPDDCKGCAHVDGLGICCVGGC